MDAETKAAFDEFLAAMNAGFDRLARGPEAVEGAPEDPPADCLRDVRWDLATLRSQVAATRNELAAIGHTLAILENRLKEIERQQMA